MSLVKAIRGKWAMPSGHNVGCWRHKLTLIREGRTGPSAVITAVMTLESGIDDERKLRDGLRKAVSQWAKETPEGMDRYAYAADDMNVGDLACCDLSGIIIRFPGCLHFDIEIPDVAIDWVFDTQLCDEIPE